MKSDVVKKRDGCVWSGYKDGMEKAGLKGCKVESVWHVRFVNAVLFPFIHRTLITTIMILSVWCSIETKNR